MMGSTMQVSAHPIAAVAAPPAAPSGGSAPQGEDSPFAKLLSAQKGPVGPEAPEPHDTAADAADKAPERPAEAARPASNATRPAKPAAPRAGSMHEAPHRVEAAAHAIKEVAASDPKSTPAEPKDDAKVDDPAAATMDPALAQWLASLNRPTPPAAAQPPGAAPPGTETTAVALAPAGAAAKTALGEIAPKPGPDLPEAHAPKVGERKTIALEISDPAGPAPGDIVSPQLTEERHAGLHAIERPSASDSAGPIGVPALNAATRAEPAPAAIALNLPTPVSSPEFKGALGVQVSVLARDGVQHAQLHLNPAEMGPISVQIALDGSQAQVDFGADSAHTRRIIESGLPELASALRDAGFTLSGGGVSQHSRGQGQGDGEGGRRGASQRLSGAAATGPARSVNLRLPLGAVDLYA